MLKFKAKYSYSGKEVFGDDLIRLVEEVKHDLIASYPRLEVITFSDCKTSSIIDRMEFRRDMFSNNCHFRMRGIE